MKVVTRSKNKSYNKKQDDILDIIKGMDVDDALQLLEGCKGLILNYSKVGGKI